MFKNGVLWLFTGTIGGATTFASAKVKNAIGRIGIFMFKFDEPSMLHGDNFSHR